MSERCQRTRGKLKNVPKGEISQLSIFKEKKKGGIKQYHICNRADIIIHQPLILQARKRKREGKKINDKCKLIVYITSRTMFSGKSLYI